MMNFLQGFPMLSGGGILVRYFGLSFIARYYLEISRIFPAPNIRRYLAIYRTIYRQISLTSLVTNILRYVVRYSMHFATISFRDVTRTSWEKIKHTNKSNHPNWIIRPRALGGYHKISYDISHDISKRYIARYIRTIYRTIYRTIFRSIMHR